MKIEGPRRTDTGNVSKTSKSKSSSGTGFSQHLSSSEGSDKKVSAASGVGGVMGIDAILSMQGAGDATEQGRRMRMVTRADSILDELENLRMGLLLGELTVSQIENLAERVKTQRENLTDPQLLELIDEIDMRAQIELAKLGR